MVVPMKKMGRCLVSSVAPEFVPSRSVCQAIADQKVAVSDSEINELVMVVAWALKTATGETTGAVLAVAR